MARSRAYFDWNATAPLNEAARAAMLVAFDQVGNPSSIHAEGRAARQIVNEAREAVAAALGAQARQVVFTSGGTEANDMALNPHWRHLNGAPLSRLIVSAVEHPSVLAGGSFAADQVEILPVSSDGIADLAALDEMLAAGGPALVALMLANNETGILQPVAEAARLIHRHGGLLHVDAVQGLGKMPFAIGDLMADSLSLSAHKIGGPKGVGALVLGDEAKAPMPLLRGGGQERNHRAGTENVIGIAGFGAAVRLCAGRLEPDIERMADLRARLEAGLMGVPGTHIFGAEVARLPNTTLFSLPGLKAETAIIAFDLEGIAVSSGSACSSGRVQPSHVLAAMGASLDLAQGAIRASLGPESRENEVDMAVKAWKKLSQLLIKN